MSKSCDEYFRSFLNWGQSRMPNLKPLKLKPTLTIFSNAYAFICFTEAFLPSVGEKFSSRMTRPVTPRNGTPLKEKRDKKEFMSKESFL